MLEQLNKYERSTLALAAVLVAMVFFVSLNIFSSATLRSAQLDLTEDGLYTLSPGTISVLKSIDEPITLRFYLSRALTEQSPVHAQYGNRVRELLEHYTNIAHGKLKLETYSPEPYSQDDDRAMSAGLRGVPLDNAGAVGYFGFSGNMDTAIAIRTIVLKDGTAYVQAGGGVVADSVPATEYVETLNKAQASLSAIDRAEAG